MLAVAFILWYCIYTWKLSLDFHSLWAILNTQSYLMADHTTEPVRLDLQTQINSSSPEPLQPLTPLSTLVSFMGDTMDWTGYLLHAKQVLCYWSITLHHVYVVRPTYPYPAWMVGLSAEQSVPQSRYALSAALFARCKHRVPEHTLNTLAINEHILAPLYLDCEGRIEGESSNKAEFCPVSWNECCRA